MKENVLIKRFPITNLPEEPLTRQLRRLLFLSILLTSVLTLTGSNPMAMAATGNSKASDDNVCLEPDLEKATRKTKVLARGICYKCIEIDPQAIAHVAFIDTTSGDWAIKPYLSKATETTTEAAQHLDSIVAVNGGFFNLSDGESTSYVVIDGKQGCEPKHNKALVSNQGLQPFLTKIFNRAELRFLKNKDGKIEMTIQPHADSPPAGLKLCHSLQGGPQLLPNYTARPEAFVRRVGSKDADSIGTNMRAGRTAFGITANKTAVIVCVEGRRTKEFAEGISLPALAEFMRRLGCVSAINFDGGTSTTMTVQAPQDADEFSDEPEKVVSKSLAKSGQQLATVVHSTPERKVKSVLYVVRTGK